MLLLEVPLIWNGSWNPRVMQMCRTLVESERVEGLMERHPGNLVVDRVSWFSWTGGRLDFLARGLLSRVLGKTHHGVVLLAHLLRLHSSVKLSCPCVLHSSMLKIFSRVIDEPVRDMLGRTVFVTGNDVSCVTWVFTRWVPSPHNTGRRR